MKPYHKNPRKITPGELSDLRTWLAELGDISGIVHDLNTDEIITGNQRSGIFEILGNGTDPMIEIIDQYDSPDEQGTVAIGYIVWEGKRYNYRQVRWTPEQCEKANIIGNHAGGEFDFDKLLRDFDADDLKEWGFKDFELGFIGGESVINTDQPRGNDTIRHDDGDFYVLQCGEISTTIPADYYLVIKGHIDGVNTKEIINGIIRGGLNALGWID